MKTILSSKARQEFFSMIKGAIRGNRQYRIVHKEGNVVIMSEEDYENLIETLELLSKPGLLKSVKKAKKEIGKGDLFTMKEVFGK